MVDGERNFGSTATVSKTTSEPGEMFTLAAVITTPSAFGGGGATSFVPPTPQIQATVATATHGVTGSRSQQTMEMFVPDGLIIMEDGALTCRFLAFFMADAD